MLRSNETLHRLIELLLSGKKVSTLDALILCGVPNLTYKICRLRKRGFSIKSNKISYNKVIKRLNNYGSFVLPPEVQDNDLVLREYWIDQKSVQER
tara:strand:+ start:61 stop:348 length:288 start_codon:yes stop_codon:yes gene_type:complete